MKRLRFLDWARGLAVIIMILCHTFNCYTRLDLRSSLGYIWSQRIGGLASVLFLFMTGMTFAFQMASEERKSPDWVSRWTAALRRSLYLFALAYGFRLINWLSYFPSGNWQGVFKVDILNCMGLAMALFSVMAIVPRPWRPWLAMAAAAGIAAASPLLTLFDWTHVPKHVYAYLVGQRGAFAAFPFASYLGFGLSIGCLVKERGEVRMGSLMGWIGLAGAITFLSAWAISRSSFTLYSKVDYWLNSPAMVAANAGIAFLVLSGSYWWSQRLAPEETSWVEDLGKQSLLVYFVHIMLVYGWLFAYWKAQFTVWQSGLATVILTAAMVQLAQFQLQRVDRQRKSRLVRTAA